MNHMNVNLDRLGKMAIIAAVSDNEEEELLKSVVNTPDSGFRIAITFISGKSGIIKSTFLRSIISCAIQNEIIEKKETHVHAVVHAALDAMRGITYFTDVDASLKIKVAVVRDTNWIAVALYGDSAYNPQSNHERASLGIMHL